MRIRTVKPEYWTDPLMVRFPPLTRLLYIATWSAADDHGYLPDEPDRLAMMVMPRDDPDEVMAALNTLIDAGRIERVECERGTCLRIVNWSRHQRVDHPAKSRFLVKPPEDSRGLPTDSESSRLDLGPRTEDLGTVTDSPSVSTAEPVEPGSSSSYPQVVDAIVTVILEEAVADGRVRNPRAYRRGVMANVEAELGAEIRNQLELAPSARPATIATRVRRAMPAAVAVVGAQLHKVGPTPKHLLDTDPEPLPDEATMTPLQKRAARRAK